MSEIILDLGSGNTCDNDPKILCQMIDEVVECDTKKHEIIFKAQLFKEEQPNRHLCHQVFRKAYEHARFKGYKMTSSVFDTYSLNFLLQFEIPFVKIACRPDLYWLIGEVPRKIPVYVSWADINDAEKYTNEHNCSGLKWLLCVPKYPARVEEYYGKVSRAPGVAISDHTVGTSLFTKYSTIWEKHLKLEDSTGPDAGSFAVTPSQLAEIL